MSRAPDEIDQLKARLRSQVSQRIVGGLISQALDCITNLETVVAMQRHRIENLEKRLGLD